MKQYKYRGWLNLTYAIVCAFIAIAVLILSFKAGVIALFSVSVQQLILFAGQRRLTEQQWKIQQNDRDERHQLIFLKSGAITASILEALTGAALIWAAFRDTDDFAIFSLGTIFIVGALAFCILQTVYNKKM